MIRLIRRRLIIPRGDTGSFSIPIKDSINDGDIAVFSIYDPLTKTSVKDIEIELSQDAKTLTVNFSHEDTLNLEPRKYKWDIKIYHNPTYDEEQILTGADEINSYYAAYSLPICEIREVGKA